MLIEPYVTTLTDTPATNDVADAAEAIDATSLFNYEQALHDCTRGDRQALQHLTDKRPGVFWAWRCASCAIASRPRMCCMTHS